LFDLRGFFFRAKFSHNIDKKKKAQTWLQKFAMAAVQTDAERGKRMLNDLEQSFPKNDRRSLTTSRRQHFRGECEQFGDSYGNDSSGSSDDLSDALSTASSSSSASDSGSSDADAPAALPIRRRRARRNVAIVAARLPSDRRCSISCFPSA
jgi:hypothetical protein